jgi:REP element-mobilizing transposase RayT
MQLRLFGDKQGRELARTQHGGERRGHRKVERPVSTRRPMHVTLHSQVARGAWSLRRHQRGVSSALRACARRSGVTVYDFANVGSHLHLLLRAKRRDDFQRFLRSFAGIVARQVTGARRGRPLSGGHFWSSLAWSRVVTWGRDYESVRQYILLNRIEGSDGRAVRLAFEEVARVRRRPRERPRRQPET